MSNLEKEKERVKDAVYLTYFLIFGTVNYKHVFDDE